MKNKKIPYNAKSGFKVPQNYFEDFEAKLMNAVTSREQEKNFTDKRLESGFKVPSNYFDNLEAEVLQKTSSISRKGKVINFYGRKETLYYIAGIAAVFIFVISTVLLKPKQSPLFTLDGVELTTLENYIDEGYIDMNYNEISSFISEEGYFVDQMVTSEINDEDVYEYLNETMEDPGLLYDYD